MSSSLMDTDNSSEQSKSNDQNTAPDSSGRTGKRALPENVDVELKKMKIETPVLEGKVSMSAEASAAPPKFVNASAMIQPTQEISDEELLEFALKFEREHGIK